MGVYLSFRERKGVGRDSPGRIWRSHQQWVSELVYRADGMRAVKFEGLTLSWQYLSETDRANQGSGFYDQISGWNTPTSRYYYDGQMGFEEDRTHFAGSFGPNIDCDVTANAIGARGIDRIQKYKRSSTDWGFSFTRSAPASDVFVYPLYDAHGNMVRTLSKTSNGYSVSAETVVDPWGTKLSTGTGEKRDYCASIGHVTDDESGMVYMRARYYEPSMGRFVSRDFSHDGSNWYTYANNAPTLFSDADGCISVLTGLGMLLGLGFAFQAYLESKIGNIFEAVTSAQLACTFLAFFFMADGLAGFLHLIAQDRSVAPLQRVGTSAFTFILNGVPFFMRGSVPMWLTGILNTSIAGAAQGNKAGGHAEAAVAAVFVYTLVLAGALLAMDYESR